MRDSYTGLLLAFQNVAKLIHHYCYGSACILFLYACIAAAILSTRLSIDFRLFLVEFAFYFIVKLVEQFDDLSKSDIKQKNVEGTIAVTISEIHYIKRIVNTLVAFGIALRFGNERLKLDALGTHLVENVIGIPRQTSFDPRWERILATFCHVKIRKCIAKSLGIQIRVPNRINDGDAKITNDPLEENNENEINKPENWDINSILKFFQYIFIPETIEALDGRD